MLAHVEQDSWSGLVEGWNASDRCWFDRVLPSNRHTTIWRLEILPAKTACGRRQNSRQEYCDRREYASSGTQELGLPMLNSATSSSCCQPSFFKDGIKGWPSVNSQWCRFVLCAVGLATVGLATIRFDAVGLWSLLYRPCPRNLVRTRVVVT